MKKKRDYYILFYKNVKLEKSDLLTKPAEWDKKENPPYAYWIYYLYFNIY